MALYSQTSIRRIIGGAGSIAQAADVAKSFNAKNVVLITDKGVYGLGLTDSAQEALKQAGCAVHVINDVPPEPSVAQVNHIFEQAKAVNCDLLVAIGGGSSMDTSSYP